MKSEIGIRKTVHGNLETIITKVTESVKTVGFGILTRIDFHQKMKEKLGETIPATVILGACNPKLAFDVYKKTTDVTLLAPCNIVIREVGENKFAVEAVRPSSMLSLLPVASLQNEILRAEKDLKECIEAL